MTAPVGKTVRFGMLDESPTDPPLFRELVAEFEHRPEAAPPVRVRKPRKGAALSVVKS